MRKIKATARDPDRSPMHMYRKTVLLRCQWGILQLLHSTPFRTLGDLTIERINGNVRYPKYQEQHKTEKQTDLFFSRKSSVGPTLPRFRPYWNQNTMSSVDLTADTDQGVEWRIQR